MKKFLYILPLIILLPVMSYALYDDFSGYESYYEVIDYGVSLAPHSVTWLADTASTGATNLTIGTGATGVTTLQFVKNNTNPNFLIYGNGIYPSVSTNQRNISGINDGYATCLLSIPTISGTISQVRIELTSSTIITGGGSKLMGTNTSTITSSTVGFTYVKSTALTGTETTPASIQSASVYLATPNSTTTFTGHVSDIRVVSKDNTTGGAWNEGSGIWEIFKIAADTVYFQIDSSGTNVTTPQLFTKAQYKDFVYSSKFKVVNTTTAYNEAGMIFRHLYGYYYRFVVSKSGTDAILKIKKNSTDTATLTITNTAIFDADTSGTSLTGNSFWLKAEVKGGNIKAYYSTNSTPLTWVQAFNYTDPSPILYGSVGVNCDKKFYIANTEVIPSPTAPTANGGDNMVRLTWSKDYSYTGEVAGYNIYRSTTAGTYGATPYAASTGIAYNDTSVVNGTTYFYKITSVISTGAVTTDETPIAFANEINATPHPGVKVSNNPFMPNSASSAVNKIKFTVYNPSSAATVLKVYQPTGMLINTISGSGTDIYWDGKNASGGVVEGGIYVWQITVNGVVAGNGTMVLAK